MRTTASTERKSETGKLEASEQNTLDNAAFEADGSGTTETATFLTAVEVAQRYRSTPNQIYQWTRDGRIPNICFIRIGRKLLFKAAGLTRWETEGGSPVGHEEDPNIGALNTRRKQ